MFSNGISQMSKSVSKFGWSRFPQTRNYGMSFGAGTGCKPDSPRMSMGTASIWIPMEPSGWPLIKKIKRLENTDAPHTWEASVFLSFMFFQQAAIKYSIVVDYTNV